jgi:hypothetical protein
MKNYSYLKNKNMYFIYHVEGIKIGCSTQPEIRVKQQNYSEFKILEEHTDIYVASDREQELQKQYGYRVDECPYWKSYEAAIGRRTIEGMRKGGKVMGEYMVKTGLLNKARLKSNEVRRGSKHSDEAKMKIKFKAMGNSNKPTIAISVFDKMNNLIGNYNSITSAANELNLHGGNISNVLKGKLQTTGGYKIKYK